MTVTEAIYIQYLFTVPMCKAIGLIKKEFSPELILFLLLVINPTDKRVAFTASMLSTVNRNHGPFDRETNLIFEKVLTNVGNAYNANTGTVLKCEIYREI